MLSYVHNQTTASAVWTINHNLNLSSMMIDVFAGDSNATPIMPLKITKTSADQVVVIFSTARSGSVRILGSSGTLIDYTGFVPPVDRAIDYSHTPLQPQQ